MTLVAAIQTAIVLRRSPVYPALAPDAQQTPALKQIANEKDQKQQQQRHENNVSQGYSLIPFTRVA